MEAPVEIGQVVAGKYVVERVLARGGVGVVVRARHLTLLEPCAIKFLLPSGVSSPLARERFLREARACARLKSDHVVRVFDVGELEGGAPYMVLEYLDGSDLEERLAQAKPLPIAEAVGYVLQVCAGLVEAHALGIVHRDLKPGNIFLSRLAEGTTRVKLLDFGISKDMYDADGGEQSRTQEGILVGSPLFMAPEQVRADEIDARTDLWAVGVILYYLLTGTHPFHGEKAAATMAFILSVDPIPPGERVASIPPELSRIILRCLEKDPARRPAGASELAAMLAPFAAEEAASSSVGRMLESSADGRVSLLGGRVLTAPPPAARPRWILPAAIGAVGVALGALALALASSSPAPHAVAAGSALAPVASAPVATNAAPVTTVTAATSSLPAPTASASVVPVTSGKAAATAIPRRPTGVAPAPGFDLGSRH